MSTHALVGPPVLLVMPSLSESMPSDAAAAQPSQNGGSVGVLTWRTKPLRPGGVLRGGVHATLWVLGRAIWEQVGKRPGTPGYARTAVPSGASPKSTLLRVQSPGPSTSVAWAVEMAMRP